MKENNYFINSKKKTWIKCIYTLFVVAIPSILIWTFFSKDILNYNTLLWWQKFLISTGFIIGVVLITLLFIYFKILDINVFTFVLPISITFMSIFLTEELVPWARTLIVIPFMFLIIPTHYICQKIETKLIIKQKVKQKISKEKIIGSK